MLSRKGKQLSPLTKGGYRGVLGRGMAAGAGLEFTPLPPLLKGGKGLAATSPSREIEVTRLHRSSVDLFGIWNLELGI
jgi:hypothetical protein